uniref:Microtubule associated tumor suppressor candidate 2a n=1 Tax=Monopterus albus TaxID=43700 RepID=A0A3Q3J256_MONAL
MSIPTSFKGLRVNVDRGGKIGNKTQIQFPQPEDDNANQLSLIGDQEGLIEGYSTSSIPPLVSQSESPDKLVIWSSDQQCMEPEVREIELLECQEIHTFSENRDKEEGNEEDNDEGSLKDGKDEGLMSISSSSTASSASIGIRRNDSNKVEGRIQKGNEVQKRSACHSIEELDTCVTGSIEKRGMRSGKESWKGGLKESKSETNVFVSSLSTISLSGSLSSALDSREVAQSLISLSNPETNPYPTANNSTSAQTRRRTAPVDGNQNSPPLHPREKYDCPQYCSQDPRQEEGSHHTNGLSSDGGLGQRRKAGFEEKVLPPRRQQLVRPLCQTEMGRARNLAESGAHQVEIGQSTSLNLSPDSHNNGSSRKFTKSSLREPSDFSHLYNTSAVTQPRQSNQTAQREASPVEKHLAANARWSSSPSNPSILEKRPQTQLTYKRNCSSSNRTGVESKSSTPPHSPLRTPQGSPRRQTSMYFVSRNVSGVVRHIPSGCNPAVTSAQGYGNSCLRAPVKTNISTSGIPKAPLNNQQSSTNSNHSSSPKESSSSPTLKPKGVRPKIITYLRKNPQFKPKAADEPYQVSSLPSRLSAYTHGQAPTSFKDTTKDLPKPDAETRGVPVLIASSLFCDKYDQETPTNIFPSGVLSRSIRTPGHTNTVPPAHIHATALTYTHGHTAPPKVGSKAGNVGPPEVCKRKVNKLQHYHIIRHFIPCTVSSSVQWERLQQEKTALEVAFERELQELQLQQETELAAVEEGLRKCHLAETEHLKAEHRSEMEELRTQQQEQVRERNHDLRKAHDQQKMLLEEDFDKLRLSLQDQVDTLTFQNQSLRDKAKRFEEALRRSTDEQIIDALAPYQHIVQDLESLKEVVEMKNQQIHRQEKKISDLEKVAQKNVFLEEKVQVLQQQNEDLKARIEMKLALSRQLSEENANLQESVEKESTEKKRLSRNNEELLWRLQTSPLMSPASSPLHRSFSSSPPPLPTCTTMVGKHWRKGTEGRPSILIMYWNVRRSLVHVHVLTGVRAKHD